MFVQAANQVKEVGFISACTADDASGYVSVRPFVWKSGDGQLYSAIGSDPSPQVAGFFDDTVKVVTAKHDHANEYGFGKYRLRVATARPVGGGDSWPAAGDIDQGYSLQDFAGVARTQLGGMTQATIAQLDAWVAGRIGTHAVIGRVLSASETANAENWVAARARVALP